MAIQIIIRNDTAAWTLTAIVEWHEALALSSTTADS